MASRQEQDEERLLRSVALQNAKTVLAARQRAEEELLQAKAALELKTKELARSLALVRATLESTTDGILVTDWSGRVTGFNQKFSAMWGVPPALHEAMDHRALLERNAREFADPQQFLAKVDEIYASSPAESYDLLELADGRVFERFSRIQFVEEHNVGRVWSFRDISARRRDERRLQQSMAQITRAEATTRFLADASASLAELTDYESTLQRVASLAVPAFADWCAVDMKAADGSVRRLAVNHPDPSKVELAHELFRRNPPRVSDLYGVAKVLRTGEPEWMAEIPEALMDSVAGDDPQQLAYIRQLGFKSYIGAPLCTRSGTIGVLSFVTAESGRRYDASDLAAAQDLASRAVIAIENANLLTALKESDRRKDEFLAILAHELRNPLAPIRNSVQILRATAPAMPQSEWATEVIDRQVQQMTRLVDDLLDVSRIAGGKLQLQKERVELAEVIGSAVESSRPLIDKWDHTLTVTMPPEPLYLKADLTRLSQVLLNLLNNAAKYTDRGGRIWLTVERERDQAVIRVQDTGIGIPKEMLPHVFDMFRQVDRSMERSEGGLGIGLTLVQRLVEKHGGTVEARSAGVGQGSEFVVRLPLAPRDEHAEPSKAGNPTQLAGGKRRMLVVDDNRDAADSLALLLRMQGNDVRTAHDGLEAVDVADDFEPEVVLLDIGLPKLNGYDAARRIRDRLGAAVVLIAVTGWGQEEDRRRSNAAGFDHHLTKPVNLVVLQQVLAPAPAPRGE